MLKTSSVRYAYFAALLVSCEIAALGQKRVYDPMFVNPHDERIVIEKGTSLTVLVRTAVNTKADSTSELVVASDVLIKGVVVIQREEHVQFSLFAKPSERFGPGGSLALYLDGVPAVEGTFVPVTGIINAMPPPSRWCTGAACPLFDSIFKERDAVIPAGTLIGAIVDDRVEIPAMEARSMSAALLQERLRPQASLPRPNLFLYAQQNEESFLRTIKVDSKLLTKLQSGEWTCSSVPPGEHEIQIDHDRFSLDADETNHFYLEILSPNDRRVVLETHGFQIEAGSLEFRSGPKIGLETRCWN